jgi:hypothetical protein
MWRWWPAAALIAAALLPAACLRPTLFPPPPDDGLCRGPLGQARELGAEPVTAVATDGQQLFAVHTKDGSLWSRPLGGGQGTGRRLAERIAPGAAAGAGGWLVASGAHVYWLARRLPWKREPAQILRVPRQGGMAQAAPAPDEPVLDLVIDQQDLLVLTTRGVWSVAEPGGGPPRRLVQGEFQALAAEGGEIYLRQLRGGDRVIPADRMSAGGQRPCDQRLDTQLYRLDRQSGALTLLQEIRATVGAGPLRIDGTHLYFGTGAGEVVPGQTSCVVEVRSLIRVPRTDGDAQRYPVNGVGPDLGVRGAHLFWLDRAAGRLFRMVKTGGRAEVVAQTTCRPDHLLLAGAQAYLWGGETGSCPLVAADDQGTLAAVVGSLRAAPRTFRLLAMRADEAYLDVDGTVRRVRVATGEFDTVSTDQGEPLEATEAALVGDQVWFAGTDFVARLPPGSTRALREYRGESHQLAAGERALYVAGRHDIVRLAAAGTAQVVVAGVGPVQALAVAGDRLFFSTPAASDRRVLWAVPGGSAKHPERLDELAGLGVLASDGAELYYAVNGEHRGRIVRHGRWSRTVADHQFDVTDLSAGARGVFWNQRRGLRWLDPSGTLRAVDCSSGLGASGVIAANDHLYWADRGDGILLAAPLPATGDRRP